MEVFYQMIIGMAHNWIILCPERHQARLEEVIAGLKIQARMASWLLLRSL
jgi:hypothetical protein